MLRLLGINRDARHTTDHIHAIGAVGLSIGNDRWSDRLPHGHGSRASSGGRSYPTPSGARAARAKSRGGIDDRRSKRLSRRGSAPRPRRRSGATAPGAWCAFSQPEPRSRDLRHLDRRQDIVVERRVALAQVKEQSLQRFAADGRLRLCRAALELRIDLASHRKLPPFSWAILLGVLWCFLFFLCLSGR